MSTGAAPSGIESTARVAGSTSTTVLTDPSMMVSALVAELTTYNRLPTTAAKYG